MSQKSSQQMFLVYSNELYNLQRDKKNPANTLIEVSNKEFVRNNYSSSFLSGYLSAMLLDHLFQLGRNASGNYQGYSRGGTVRRTSTYKTPTAAEKKAVPPLTVQTTGSIIKRSQSASGSKTGSGTFSKIKNSVSQDVGQSIHSAENRVGKIFRTKSNGGTGSVYPKHSTIQMPRSNSPPSINVHGFGHIRTRR